MDILVFAIVVILVAVLLIWLVDAFDGLKPPAPAIVRILILLAAIIVICNRAGLI